MHALTAKTVSPEEWVQQLQTQRAAVEGVAIGQARE
jgi:hypothetical protein